MNRSSRRVTRELGGNSARGDPTSVKVFLLQDFALSSVEELSEHTDFWNLPHYGHLPEKKRS